jgi:chloramphenicol-sensitive protein RarD
LRVYGLIRKLAAVDAMPGLAIESLILFLPALAWLGWSEAQGTGRFAHGELAQDALLVFGGALTALPLIGFAYGARRIPYSLVGILQYISPTLQLLCGVMLLGEDFAPGAGRGLCLHLAGTAGVRRRWLAQCAAQRPGGAGGVRSARATLRRRSPTECGRPA